MQIARVKGLKAKHWQEFAAAIGLPLRAAAAAIGLPPRAAAASNAVALRAAISIYLGDPPFTGSPLKGALRELRFWRAEMTP